LAASERWIPILGKCGDHDASGSLLGYGVMTQESRMDEKLQVRSRTALSGQNAVVVVDREGKIVLINSQAEELFGYARADLLAVPS
jgi:PAS domain-containing protein